MKKRNKIKGVAVGKGEKVTAAAVAVEMSEKSGNRSLEGGDSFYQRREFRCEDVQGGCENAFV